jgi:hypothetical protein
MLPAPVGVGKSISGVVGGGDWREAVSDSELAVGDSFTPIKTYLCILRLRQKMPCLMTASPIGAASFLGQHLARPQDARTSSVKGSAGADLSQRQAFGQVKPPACHQPTIPCSTGASSS